MRTSLVAASLLSLGLAACAAPSRPPSVSPTSAAPPPSIASTFEQCRDALAEAGVAFEVQRPTLTREGCGYGEGIKVNKSHIPLNQPAVMSCQLALAFLRFEEEVVQPAALRHFRQSVTKTHHVGTFHCRRINGAAKWSQHAFANAIDIMGFDLSDGTRIAVARDWRARGPRSAFLHDIARGACRIFRVTLTPNYDRAHANHIHLDLGPDRVCGL